MAVRVDITGNKYGRLTAVKELKRKGTGRTRYYWQCACDCGGSITVLRDSLVSGATKSCGCLAAENDRRFPEKIAAERVENTCICLLTSKTRTDNTSGYNGVSYNKKRQRWAAYLILQGKRHHLGYFKNLEDAVKARQLGEEAYFKPVLERYGRQ